MSKVQHLSQPPRAGQHHQRESGDQNCRLIPKVLVSHTTFFYLFAFFVENFDSIFFFIDKKWFSFSETLTICKENEFKVKFCAFKGKLWEFVEAKKLLHTYLGEN